MFDPFFTTKDVSRGTGQGLAIARAIIDRHHGQLSVETVAGKGTTSQVRLPVRASGDRTAVAVRAAAGQ